MALKTCPSCKKRHEVNTLLAAKPYLCECGNRYILNPVVPDNHGAANDAVHNPIADAISSRIYKHSVSLIYKKLNGSEELSSGTAIKIDDKILIATSGHSLKKAVKQSMWLIPKIGNLDQSRSHIKKCFKFNHEAGKPDVGILELNEGIDKISNLDSIPIKSLYDSTTGDSKRLAFLCGSPSDYITLEGNEGKVGHMIRIFMPISAEAWHSVESSFPDQLDVDRHIILYHDQNTVSRHKHKSNLPPNPAPHGMSGGGYWQLPPRNIIGDKVWAPSEVELIGLQSSVSGDGDFLKGFQIAWWIKLVSLAYPEYRADLEEQFRRLDLFPDLDFDEY